MHCVPDLYKPCSLVATQTGSPSQGTQLARLSVHACCMDNPHILQGRVNKHGLHESLRIPRMESMESFSKTHSYCKKSKITLWDFFFFWPHLDVDVTNPGFCPVLPETKLFVPRSPVQTISITSMTANILNHIYIHSFDIPLDSVLSTADRVKDLTPVWRWLSCFIFLNVYYFSHLLISELLTKQMWLSQLSPGRKWHCK